ncbi:hypothetical protein CO180_02940 [candidate division WWE3 bacterium CG_4_9_14_3_um_filter_41_6]|uniref:Polymerase nucleotidyl transferase domain-containing protein n=1 Tax=candidate division WWE3 bacterium CG_4_10_14_0_2_um_filter_41_14 TaxID=1975072 RepID=A0A2M7TLJ1_UNCKA|nr:MAG: hypothetical protein COY32_00765 [candidate division WWE3 bacterium CG_4_10_14_0_2_um_filter_41_14]PJA38663.1 MAG: hypothetical protein CO180_02940 [candidate division WWE3 bacterium CG_4_9_14_3_um_filter_41_6]
MNEKLNIDSSFIDEFCTKHAINYLGLFGSFARNEQTPTSDVDVLVDFDHPQSLFGLSRIKSALETQLGKPVDLVTRNSLKPTIKSHIEKDIRTLYEKR